MKRQFTSLILIALTISLFPQPPQKMSYQAVIRNSSGQLVSNHAVGMRISILQGSATGIVVYSETYNPVPQTNVNGLVTVEIGSGTPSTGTFPSINWSNGPYFLKTEADPSGGTGYSIVGTSQLLSVPYALLSKSTENYTETDPVFGASPAKGITNGSITNWNTSYSWGNHAGLYKPNTYIPVWTEVTGKPAGFADGVDNVDDADNDITNEIQALSLTGTQLSLSRGGGNVILPAGENFTLPYNGTASSASAAFKITNSTGDGINGTSNASDGNGLSGLANSTSGVNSGVKGISYSSSGFGVYGESPNLGISGKATSTSGINYGIKGESLSISGSGVYGESNATSGTAVGVLGRSSAPGGRGLIGQATSSACDNCIGVQGRVNSSNGYSGFFDGGKFYINGRTGIGTNSPEAGLHISGSGWPESFVYIASNSGEDAGLRLYEGVTAKWHIFNNSAAGGLQIYNSDVSTSIFCRQTNSYVGIRTTNPLYPLHVNGEAAKSSGTTAWVVSSDVRLKNILGKYEKGLNEIVELQPVRFTYQKDNPRQLPSDKEQVGFIAQEVKEIFPEAVTEGTDGYLDFNIHAISVAMINAIRELKAENEKQKAEINKLEDRISKLENKLEATSVK